MRHLIIIITLSIALMLFVDIAFGLSILTKIYDSSEKSYRIRHPVYHHTLRENIDTGKARWGSTFYRVCTNRYGFKCRCDMQEKDPGKYDVAFIGDSFTEAIGMPYSDSFVGMIDAEFPDMSVANLGVSSYSPKIYLSKLDYLLKRGVRLDHLFVFIDISDIQDDGSEYIYEDGYVHDRVYDGLSLIDYYIVVYLKKYFPLTFEVLKNSVKWALGVGKAPSQEPRNSNKLAEKKEAAVSELPVFNLDRSAWTYDIRNENYGANGVEGAVSETIQYMIKLHELLASHDIELSVGIYPWPGQLAHDTIRSWQVRIWSGFCETRCTHFVNLFPFFFDQIDKHGLAETYYRYFIDGDVHFNERGHSVIAKVIANELRKNNE